MRLLFVLFAVALAYPINGQICTCESNFEWVKKTFEENDAGFQYIIGKKGQAAYNIHNQLMREKVKVAKTLTECTVLLNEWLKFFRSGHIGIQCLKCETSVSQNVLQTTNKTGVYETWKGNISQFEKYISEKKEADYEGIWDYNGIYKIGIKKEDTNYVGFIIESDVDEWSEPGLVKLKIEQDGDHLKSTFIMRNYSPVESGEPELMGSNYLQIAQQTLKRLSPVFPDDPFVENYFKYMNASKPFLEELNATTLYLHIPSFNSGNKPAIDKLLADNKDKILKTENLIIDLRYNGGGSDESYAELMPFLYTNAIRTPGVEFLSTTLNNQRMLEFINNPEYEFDEERKKWVQEAYDKLDKRLGTFVNINPVKISVEKFDTIHTYPKNVGIIINEGCASTTEQFLLAAKQSKKVKLLGVTTMGALDMSNMWYAESPCKEFRLRYSLSRSFRIPENVIDDIGIQPDYYLDKTIPQYKWVEFVNEVLNQ